ncbi:hypothetical protein M407DRAFT_8435 [Tulasnella calospora MUT 4182]|uniref:Uncharacterized protein n=1 Tax=Tulasnella calospora MUT 4182 TaxID=1051891 RepID=A0A0C3LVJ1_9AGAM|nr:hypothetical protein M407DRAFT_8435 [Tulasnella calospora MUT 4182]
MAESAVQNDTNGSPTSSKGTTTPGAYILTTPHGDTYSPRHVKNAHVHTSSMQNSSNLGFKADVARASSPLTKKSKTDHNSQAKRYGPPSTWAKLSVGLKLAHKLMLPWRLFKIFAYLEGDSLMAVWRTLPEFYQVFYHPGGVKLWGEVRLVTRSEFVEKYGHLFGRKRAAFEEIGWHNPVDMPGLEFIPMATNFIEASPEQRSHFVASRQLADAAAKWVQQLEQEHPTKSEAWIDREVQILISNTRGARKVLSDYAPKLQEHGSVDVDHLRIKREKRTERLSAMLENYPAPTPASLQVPPYHDLENVADAMIGIFPISVFLKVCANVDLHTIAAIEKVSKLVLNVLRSRAADPTWRAIKASLGLNSCFDHWPERAFLAYAIRRRCFVDHSGYILDAQILTPCDWHSVIEIGKNTKDLPKNVIKCMTYVQSGPFVSSGWVNTSKKATKLYPRTYVTSLTRWMKELPATVTTCVPEGLIVKHIASYVDPFIKVAKICETWQKHRDPRNVRLMDRQGQA